MENVLPTTRAHETFATSRDQLLAALAFVNLRVRWALRRAQLNGRQLNDNYVGLHMTADQAVVLGEYKVGQHPWLYLNGGHSAEVQQEAQQRQQQIEAARQRWWQATYQTQATGRLLALSYIIRSFQLDPIDVEILLLAIAPAIEPPLQKLYGFLMDNLTAKQPSIYLLVTLLA